MVGLGVYVDKGKSSLGGVIGFIVAIATTGFAANGAAYAIYGHLRPKNIGFVAGIVGASGNIGGLWYTLVFKYQPGTKPLRTLGKKFWIAGILNIALAIEACQSDPHNTVTDFVEGPVASIDMKTFDLNPF